MGFGREGDEAVVGNATGVLPSGERFSGIAVMDSLSGHFLVASPQLVDPNFVRTVVLVIEHTPDGALGLVINRPTNKTVGELLSEVGAAPPDCRRPLFLGGPVPGPLMSIHCHRQWAEMEVIPGVFLSAKKTNIDELIRSDDETIKVFVGHSGWGPGQLDREMTEGAWLTTTAQSDVVFSVDPEVWTEVCRRIGRDFLGQTLGIRQFPPDPTVN